MSNKQYTVILWLCGGWLLLLSVLSQPTIAQDIDSVSIPSALAQGQISIEQMVGNSPDGRIYRQPLISMQIKNNTTLPLILSMPAGAILVPIGTNHSPMVTLGLARGTIELAAGDVSSMEGVFAFNIQVQKYPDSNVSYQLDPVQNTSQQVLDVLEYIRQQGGVSNSDLAHQLAIWQVAAGAGADCQTTMADVQNVFQVDMGCESDLSRRAQELIAANPTTPSNGVSSTPTLPNSIPPDDSVPDSSVFTKLIIGFGALILALVAYFGYTIWNSRRETSRVGATSPTHKHVSNSENGDRSSSNAKPSEGKDRQSYGRGRRVFDTPTGSLIRSPDSSSGNKKQEEPEELEEPEKPEENLSSHQAIDGNRHASQTTPFPLHNSDKRSTSSNVRPFVSLHKPKMQCVNLAEPHSKPVPISSGTLLCRGKMNQCIITRDNHSISTPHCVIRFLRDSQCWMIKDLASRNGTFVGNERVSGTNKPLKRKDQIRLGSVNFRFEGSDDGSEARLIQLDATTTTLDGLTYTFDPGSGPYWLITAEELDCLEITEDRSVSAPHALILFKDGWKIRDLNSASGTWVTRERFNQDKPYQIEGVPRRIHMYDHLALSAKVSYRCEPLELPKVGKYRLEQWKGSGGMASVFLAYSNVEDQDNTPRVLKLLKDTNTVDAFRRECELLQQFNGTSGFVGYEMHGEDQHYGWYLVMEYINGATLESILRSRQEIVLAEPDVIEIAQSICHALVALHAKNLVHCDLKPENILISSDGQVYLSDLGAVTVAGNKPAFLTRNYAPPEFTHEFDKVIAHPKSDLYSLGVVMYEMLYGGYYQPENLDDRDSVIGTISFQEPTPTHFPPALPNHDPTSALDTLIKRCLRATTPYTSADEVLQDLKSISTSVAIQSSSLSELVRNVDVFAKQ